MVSRAPPAIAYAARASSRRTRRAGIGGTAARGRATSPVSSVMGRGRRPGDGAPGRLRLELRLELLHLLGHRADGLVHTRFPCDGSDELHAGELTEHPFPHRVAPGAGLGRLGLEHVEVDPLAKRL